MSYVKGVRLALAASERRQWVAMKHPG